MAKHQQRATTFSVTISTEMAQAVFQQVRDGIHGSAGAVIREALRLMLKVEDGEATSPPAAKVANRQIKRGGSRLRSD